MQVYIIQVLAAFGGTICFSILFNSRKKRLLLVGICGALTWIAYLILYWFTESEMVSYFFASMLAAAMAEIFARIVRCPSTVLLVPNLIPLMPGGRLYYTMFYLVSEDHEQMKTYLDLLLTDALSLSFGVIVVISIVQVGHKMHLYRAKKR